MTAKRERVLELARRIMVMRAEIQTLETELDQLIGTEGPAGVGNKQTSASEMSPAARERALAVERERAVAAERELELRRERELELRREREAAVRELEQRRERAVAAERERERALAHRREREMEIVQHTLGQKAVALLDAHKPTVMDVKEIAVGLRADVPTTRTVLWRLVRAGEVVKVAKGVYRAKMPGETVTLKPDDAGPEGDD